MLALAALVATAVVVWTLVQAAVAMELTRWCGTSRGDRSCHHHQAWSTTLAAHALEGLPAAPAHFIWMNWSPKLARADMAYSLEDETYIAMYGIWRDPADQMTVTQWVLQ